MFAMMLAISIYSYILMGAYHVTLGFQSIVHTNPHLPETALYHINVVHIAILAFAMSARRLFVYKRHPAPGIIASAGIMLLCSLATYAYLIDVKATLPDFLQIVDRCQTAILEGRSKHKANAFVLAAKIAHWTSTNNVQVLIRKIERCAQEVFVDRLLQLDAKQALHQMHDEFTTRGWPKMT